MIDFIQTLFGLPTITNDKFVLNEAPFVLDDIRHLKMERS